MQMQGARGVCALRALVVINFINASHIFPPQDEDHDSKVSLEDFHASIVKETLLIEAFGPCLPTREDVEKFCNRVFG